MTTDSTTLTSAGGDFTAFDSASTIVWYTQRGGGSGPSTAMITMEKAANGESITFRKVSSGGGPRLEWTIVELDNVTVTDLSFTSLEDQDVLSWGKTLTDVAETFVIATARNTGSGYTADDQYRITIGSTSGTFHSGGDPNVDALEIQLVECPDVIVNEETNAELMGTGELTETFTISSTGGDETMIIAMKETASSNNFRHSQYFVELASTTTISQTRESDGTDDDQTLTAHVVRFQDTTTVQYAEVDFPDQDDDETLTGGVDYTTVDEDRSLLFICSQANPQMSSGEQRRHNDDWDDGCAGLFFSGGGTNDGSEITARRLGLSSSTNNLRINVGIVEFPEAAAGLSLNAQLLDGGSVNAPALQGQVTPQLLDGGSSPEPELLGQLSPSLLDGGVTYGPDLLTQVHPPLLDGGSTHEPSLTTELHPGCEG